IPNAYLSWLPCLQIDGGNMWKEDTLIIERDCLTCVLARGTGPVAAGLDVTSKGTMGRNLKYLMIARYNLPVEYVKGYTARDGSADKELGAELAEPSRLPPHEDGDPFILEPGEQGQERDQSSEDANFIGGTRKQQADYQDYDDSMYEPSEPEEPPKELQEDTTQNPSDPDPHQDCVAPASTYLLFAKALPSNGSAVVKAALQDVILYLQAHGLPIYRLHADKGETYNHSVRTWLRDQAIRATWSEPGIPQGNGQAEGAVRWIKDKARTLLLSSRLPTRLWPTAVEAAAAMQRARVLGWKSKLLAPFGAVVHVKQKVFDSSGPRRRERAFESKWIRGRYVGLSSILDNGHVVYIPEEQGGRKSLFILFMYDLG
ncbi:unnamed protein product, partial [Symbiodinium sp. CCMP2456]